MILCVLPEVYGAPMLLVPEKLDGGSKSDNGRGRGLNMTNAAVPSCRLEFSLKDSRIGAV